MAAIAAAAAVAVASTAVSVGTQAAAADKARSANYKARHQVKRFDQRVREFQDQIYKDTAPFREMAMRDALRNQGVRDELIPYLMGELTQGDEDFRGFGKGFDLAAKEGIDAIQRNFAVTGSPGSGAAGIAAGRFTEGLVARERDYVDRQKQLRIGNLFRLAGIVAPNYTPTTGISEAAGLFGVQQQNVNNQAALTQQQGAADAALIANTGESVSQLIQAGGSIAGAYGGGATTAGSAASGGSSIGAGNYGIFGGANPYA